AITALSLLCLGSPGLTAAEKQPLPATVRVALPADATLTVDGHATTSTSAARWFVTPLLQPDQEFQYRFKAQVVRGGRLWTRDQVVDVQAGRETKVALGAPEAGGWSDSGPAPAPAFSYTYAPYRPGTYETGGGANQRVLSFSDQDPLLYAGRPGSNNPL